MPLTGKNDNPKKKGQKTMNYYGILTNYEECVRRFKTTP